MTLLKKSVLKKNMLITVVLVVAIVTSGFTIDYFMNMAVVKVSQPKKEKTLQIDTYFNRAIEHMKRKRYKQAVTQWQQLLLVNSTMPEAHVNLGFSYFETGEYKKAMMSFQRAMDLNPYQTNAYYGLAICYEKLGDLRAASGSMRSYIHLSKKDDPFVRKAQSALWEWQAQQQKLGENNN